MKNLDDLLHGLLQDVYFAEKQLLKALPQMAKKAASEELAQAFLTHRDQTEAQIARLEQAFEMIEKKPRGKKMRRHPRHHPGGQGSDRGGGG